MPPTAAAPALPKQNLDYIEHPDGSLTAVLTVTFANGEQKRFETLVTREEAESVQGEYVGAEIALIGPNGEVGFFGFIKKAVKSVGKVVKAVAASKIMKIAATGLAVAAPILGPLAPAALAASAGLGIAGKLASAGAAAASGAKEMAKQLTAQAGVDAKALTKTAAGAASLLKAANAKRVAADNIPARKPGAKRTAPAKPKLAAKPAAKPPLKLVQRPKLTVKPAAKPAAAKPAAAAPYSEADLLARARAGRVRSNQKGVQLSEKQLLEAHKAGRIIWVV